MIKQYTKDINPSRKDVQDRYKWQIEILKEIDVDTIIDAGHRNPFSELMEKELGVKVINTSGDLDHIYTLTDKPTGKTVCVISSVIYHLFNPISLLERMRNDRINLIIFDVIRPFWNEHNFHEIDTSRMLKLLERTGYKCTEIRTERIKNFKPNFGWKWIIRYLCDKRIVYFCEVSDV